MVPNRKLPQCNVNACEFVRTVHITSVTTLKLMAREKLPSEYALNCYCKYPLTLATMWKLLAASINCTEALLQRLYSQDKVVITHVSHKNFILPFFLPVKNFKNNNFTTLTHWKISMFGIKFVYKVKSAPPWSPE